MNVVHKESRHGNQSEYTIFDQLSDVQKETSQVLEYIEEITGKPVLEYQKSIVNNLQSFESKRVLEQRDYFRFTVGYLLKNNIQTSLKYHDYATYVLDKNKALLEKEEQSNKLALSRSLRKKDLLYEALAPIHNRLMRIKTFFDKLNRYDQLGIQTKFNIIYNSKITVIEDLSKQLISDKGDLSKLEEDAKYMRAQEQIIMSAAKESYKLYMLQIYKASPETKALFNQGSTKTLHYSDYKGLQSLFDETVKNSEDFWIFHDKFFSILIRLGLREERRKKKR